ncbi:MAG: cysteine hydrolase [Proteobacteria bacterium]|nr:cysteine hydrolase [Pseudomonadota bacterium]
MGRIALLIVDMLNDFLDPAGALYCGDDSRRIIPVVRELLETHRAQDSVIIFVSDHHASDDREFLLFPPHCVQGTPGAATIPEIEVRSGDHHIYKNRYSAFYGTDLDEILRRESVDEVHLAGVCTSICVMETTSDLRNRDIRAIVHRGAVADFDPKAHDFALERMEKILGAEIED